MSKYLTDQWNQAADDMQVFFAEMDAKIANAKAVVTEAETAASMESSLIDFEKQQEYKAT